MYNPFDPFNTNPKKQVGFNSGSTQPYAPPVNAFGSSIAQPQRPTGNLAGNYAPATLPFGDKLDDAQIVKFGNNPPPGSGIAQARSEQDTARQTVADPHVQAEALASGKPMTWDQNHNMWDSPVSTLGSRGGPNYGTGGDRFGGQLQSWQSTVNDYLQKVLGLENPQQHQASPALAYYQQQQSRGF